MALNVKEAARLLKVSAQSIYRLIHRERLPVQTRGDQYQFDRVELEEWSRNRPGAGSSESQRPSLRAAIRHGGIHYDVPARDRDSALFALAALPGDRVALAPAQLFEMLLAREQLAPTTVGGGFALPHPRDSAVSGVELEYLHVACFQQPVDFHALDERPVHTALLLLSPDTETHLQLLALVSLVLRDREFRRLLTDRAPPDEIRGRLDALLELVEARGRA